MPSPATPPPDSASTRIERAARSTRTSSDRRLAPGEQDGRSSRRARTPRAPGRNARPASAASVRSVRDLAATSAANRRPRPRISSLRTGDTRAWGRRDSGALRLCDGTGTGAGVRDFAEVLAGNPKSPARRGSRKARVMGNLRRVRRWLAQPAARLAIRVPLAAVRGGRFGGLPAACPLSCYSKSPIWWASATSSRLAQCSATRPFSMR
jgi:hypothetical protein